MEFTIIGIKRKTGNYEGRDYDNLYLHCTYLDDGMLEGVATTVVKIKQEHVDEQLKCGDKVTFFYDRYGNAVKVNIL